MLANNSNSQKILASNCKTSEQMESTSLKFLDMIAFVIRIVNIEDANCDKLLNRLGIQHDKMGVNIKLYRIMLQQMHQTLAFYFPNQYTDEVL